MGRALIVSAGASSNEYIAARLTEMGYSRPVIIPSGAEARRRMTESDFELIVVNSPLPDEFGHEVCINAVEKTDAGVVFLVKAAQAEQLLGPLSEQGVLLLSKPFSTAFFCAGHAHGGGGQPPPAACPAGERPLTGKDRTGAAGQPGKMLPCGARAHDRSRGTPLHRKTGHGYPA